MSSSKSAEASSPVVPTSPFSSILNFRDVGLTVNQLSQSKVLRTGLIYRSARPDGATTDDLDILRLEHKIRTVIDLRSNTELQEQARKLDSDARKRGPSAVERLLCNHVHVDLNGGPFARALMSKLGWSSFFKLILFYAVGWRVEAIRILGSEVMQPRGLVGLAIDSLDHSQVAIRAVFEVLGNEKAYPVLIHCTQGKDRTGLIVIILLLMLEIPIKVVDQDYRASPTELLREEDARLKEIQAIGLGPSFAGCPDDFVESVHQHLATKYGGAYSYLQQCGLSVAVLDNMKRTLIL